MTRTRVSNAVGTVKQDLDPVFVNLLENKKHDLVEIRRRVRADADKSLLKLTKKNSGETALHIAANLGKIDVARVLLAEGADIHAVKKQNNGEDTEISVMTAAITRADYDLVAMLLEKLLYII